MKAAPPSGSPQFSIVLATDTYDTLRPVIAELRRQTAIASIELVIVAPVDTVGPVQWDQLSGFFGVRVIDTRPPLSLAVARATGVRAAAAPIVFVGETHCFPEPEMAERLTAAFCDDRCAAVIPAIVNANPASTISWACYLTDYGMWGAGRLRGMLSKPALYNGAYRRSALVALGDRLDALLDTANEELWPTLKRNGYYARFEPGARTRHLNATQLRAMLRLRFCAGLLIGWQRGRRWTLLRRVGYVTASPLVVLVLTWRIRSIVRFGAAGQTLPAAIMPIVALGAMAKVLGEAIGYLGLKPLAAEQRLTEIELHKARYAGPVPESNA
jgi:hypothetical protein